MKACVDESVFRINEDGQMTFVGGAFGAREAIVYRAGGTFKKDKYAGIARVLVQVQAAGGGSAGANASKAGAIARAGAAGGGYGEAVIDVKDLAAEEPITVGKGGKGGKGNKSGGKGGGSAFGKHVTANGGSGSKADMTANDTPVCYSGTAGPAAGNGPGWNTGGGSGSAPFRIAREDKDGNQQGDQALSGEGGSSVLGMTGQPRASSAGVAGRGYGAGAGGVMVKPGASRDGEDGQDGVVIVWVFAG